ncbi:MAG TPA: dienelactone hydrolase family protein [Candidatus Dormibacteraeota bacterium]|nr:dienelactone hydrolase family protein [Candidatus Dormibacteraeota bacterium]
MTMQTRDIESSELKGGGYLALPDGGGRHPGVVVIHEAYGLNGNIKSIARRFAGEGYAALAVDLFSGRNRAVCMSRYMAGMLLGSVNRHGIFDLKSALTMLAKMPQVDAQRMGAIGFCLGGGFAIAWACTDSRLKAIAPFYGVNPRPLQVARRLCPVVGSYPEKDFTARAGRSLEQALDRSGIAHDIKVYPGARHSFFNEAGRAYDKEAADDSWRRVMTFFGEHLGATS